METITDLACLEVRGGNVPADVSMHVPGLMVHVVSVPYHAAAGGGDVHYVSSCGTGRITRVMLADVAGHGSDVDEAARILQRLMRRNVNRIESRAFVARMNEGFAALTPGGMFATALIATYFAPTRSLNLINAGHPPPLLYRAADRSWSYLESDVRDLDANLPLGITGGTAYEPFELTLQPGDAVVCYTDSLPESRDAVGELLGYDRLRELAQALDYGQSLSDWVRQWLGTIDALSPGNLTGDDLTVLLLRATEGPDQSRLAERVRGIGRMFLTPLRRDHPFPWPEFTARNIGGSLVPWLGRGRPKATRHAE